MIEKSRDENDKLMRKEEMYEQAKENRGKQIPEYQKILE